MSYRYRTDPYAATRPGTTLTARNAMLGMLVTFVVVAALVFLLGDIDQRLNPQPVSGVSYQQVKLEYAERLSTYGWVDRSAGSVHIPIERAIELTAQRGLPVRQ